MYSVCTCTCRGDSAQWLCVEIMLYSLAVLDLNDLISVIGAVASSALALIFPPFSLKFVA